MIDTAFVSTRLSLHPSSAQSALREWHQSLPPVMRARGCVRFENRLWLAAMPEQGNPDPDQLYAVRGTLWMNGRPIRVGLECSMWSGTVSQLALRPALLAWPVRTDRYGRRAVQVLEDVVGSVMGTAALHRARGQQPQIAMVRGALVRPAA
jgi:hypothetical protein